MALPCPPAKLNGVHRVLCLLLASICTFQASGDTVLVLPFFNLSDSSNLDWIGESIAETIRETLVSEDVLVLDRDRRQKAYRRLALRQYTRLSLASVIKLGEAAEAGSVVYGAFEVSASPSESTVQKESLSVSVKILDLTRMKQGPELSASGELDGLAALQDHLAWQTLLQFVEPRMAPSAVQFHSRRRRVRLDAMENYIRGLAAVDPDQKHRFFTQAARLDEDFSQPRFQLGKFQWEKKNYRVAAGWLERVSSTDPDFYEATFLLGLCRYHMADYEKAQASFELVLESYRLAGVWNNLGAAQSRRDLPEALESFEKALEADPEDPVYNFNVGYALWRIAEYDEAADSFRAVLDRNPGDSVAMTMLGRCLKKNGPRPRQTRVEALERLKGSFDAMAYRIRQTELAATEPEPGISSSTRTP
jgi:tetratricopeptide (TPR) repeat protein